MADGNRATTMTNAVRGAAVAALVLLTGCSFSIGSGTVGERVAEALETQGADELGLGAIEVMCAEPPNEDAGTIFECTSSGGPGGVVWRVTLEEGEEFNAWTVNLITAEGAEQVEVAVAREASTALGQAVDPGDVDCGSGPLTLGDDLELVCAVATSAGTETESTVVFTDIRQTGEDQTAIDSIAVAGGDASAAPTTAVQTAVSLIESQAVALDLGPVDVRCEEPPDQEVGTTFTCVSAAEAGNVGWLVTVDRVDHINAETTNLVRADIVPAVEEAAVSSLEANSGEALGVENFDCGTGPKVLDDGQRLVCALTDPVNGDVYDAIITFTDLGTGAFSVVVAEQPRA